MQQRRRGATDNGAEKFFSTRMNTTLREWARPVAAAAAALACCAIVVAGGVGGCATATVAAAGSAVGLAASAISTGGDIYRLGKLDAADEARYHEWIAACRAAVSKQLHYRVEKDWDYGNGRWICTVRDARRTRVVITVERRTETVCLTRVDVGVLGSEPTARLILATIRQQAHPQSPPPLPPPPPSGATPWPSASP